MDNEDKRASDHAALTAEVERLTERLAAAEERAAMLEAAAHEDPLTGILNRRGFERELRRAIAYRARYGAPLALLVADLDGFKAINDTHGHGVGDAVLRHVAGVLGRHIRASDSIGRLGGDEFAVLLWQVYAPDAEQKARRLQQLVEATPLGIAGGPIAAALSMGAGVIEPTDTPESALARADKALYADKSLRQRDSGRHAP